MATAPKDAAVVVPEVIQEAAVTQPTKSRIRAVYGKMVDPFTKVTYDQAPIDYRAPSGWVSSQLDAGKMELVD